MDNQSKPFSVKTIAIVVAIGVAAGIVVCVAPAFLVKPVEERQLPLLKMGGTSAALFMMDKWENIYRKKYNVKLDYFSTGSTKGVEEMIEKKTSIGFTHEALSEAQLQRAKANGGEVLHIPVLLCGVVPIYNVKGLNYNVKAKDESGESYKGPQPLNFTGEVLAKIYLGRIKKWNDREIEDLNPEAKAKKLLPDKEIIVVHRQDSSGTTLVFANYLHDVSQTWRDAEEKAEKVGKPDSQMNWPTGVGMKRNSGVAVHVAGTDGAIGYVDLLHAKAGNISYGTVKNRAGNYIYATPDNITAASHQLGKIKEDLTFKLTDMPGEKSYPISGGVWAVCYRNQTDANRAMVADFLHWVTHDGQKFARDRIYSPLPDDIVGRIDERLKLIKTAPL